MNMTDEARKHLHKVRVKLVDGYYIENQLTYGLTPKHENLTEFVGVITGISDNTGYLFICREGRTDSFCFTPDQIARIEPVEDSNGES
jgi:hypothetical protein